jgi:hypothetical protein
MSKVKAPTEKKRISLVKDRRNVYGECPTSSRKNISRGKQRGHMEVRRAANEELRSLRGASTEVDADATGKADGNRVGPEFRVNRGQPCDPRRFQFSTDSGRDQRKFVGHGMREIQS